MQVDFREQSMHMVELLLGLLGAENHRVLHLLCPIDKMSIRVMNDHRANSYTTVMVEATVQIARSMAELSGRGQLVSLAARI